MGGFSVVVKGNLADQVFPAKETMSKPKAEDQSWVHHFSHKWKHGEPLSTTGNPPVSHKQAIAIGLSVEKRGGTKASKKAKVAKKSIEGEDYLVFAPGGFENASGGFGVVIVEKGYVGFKKLATQTSPEIAAAVGRKKYGEGAFKEMAKEGRTAPEHASHLERTKGKKAAKTFRDKIAGKKGK